MTIGSVLPLPMAYPAHQDPNQTLYGFHCDVWEESPSPAFGQDWFPDEERFRRDANANAYRQYGNPMAWNRYITLGYFALEDCVEFDQLWKNFDKDPLAVHRVIWYQFMYHVDRDMPIPERLNAWAMNVSHAYLEYHDATSLAMDTLVKWKSQEFNTSMDTEPTDDPWIPVVATRRSRNKSPPAPPIASNNTTQSRKPPGTMHELPNRKVNQNPQTAMLKDWSRYQKLVRPASRPPKVSTVPEDEDEDVTPIDPDAHVDIGSGSLQGSLATPAPHRPSSFPTIAVNDGSHRLTFKWSLPNRIQAYERDNNTLMESVRNALQTLFTDEDGMIVRWNDEDLGSSALVSSLNVSELREFLSPTFKFWKSTSQLGFNMRFRFADNPVSWQLKDHTKSFLRASSIDVLVSNTKSTSGNIVTAGYILLKAPNTTSLHRYTQFLRSQLPETTPFFDIVRFKKTPLDQLIPHLVVQCGESHVTMISQTFLPLLTGKSSALFLPRYAFGAMTEEQVSNQFLVHEKWARSLTALPLAPLVFHLDQKRIEHCNDGTSIERSTREWAATLTFPDGTPGLCDVVNGTAEKKAYLLSPTNFSDYAKEQLRQYRLRLSPPSRREARFRDNVPDLPDIIHIKTAIHSNVSFMEDLLKADAWNPPHGSQSHAVNSGTRTNATSKPNAPPYPQARNAWAMPLKLSAQQSQKTSGTLPSGGDDSVTLGSGGENSIGTAERSTASTQSTTLASESPYHARLRELENVTKTKLKVLEETSRDSANKLQSLEKQLGRLDNMDKKMETVQEDLKSVARKLEESMESQHGISDGLLSLQKHSQKQFQDMGSHLVTAVENVNTLTGAMSDIKIEFAKMSQFMQDLASRQQVSPPALESRHRNNHRKAQLHVNDAAAQSQPSSSCDTSLGSAHSKQSHDSDTNSSAVSGNSKASSTLRSPPPKRTREGRVLEQNDSMIIEHHEDNGSLAHDADEQSNDGDDGSASGSGSKVVVNLENRFSGVPSMQGPVESGSTPRPSSDKYQQSPDIPSPSIAAPLDSQYTPSHGPDGAGGE